MSKSYRQVPFIIQEKEDTHYLNRCLRHDKLAEIPNGSAYKHHKKHDGSWKYRWDWKEAKANYYKMKRWQEMTLEEWYQCWKRWTLRK